MNSSAKNLLLEKARSLLLDAVGCMSCPIAPQLSEKLEKAGPVPFAPADIEKRLAPEEILADTKSIAVILFPYRYPEEKNANIALYARAKDYHHVVRAYLAKIIGYMEEQYPNEKFHAITDTSPMADRWLAYQAGLGFFGRNHCLIHPKYGSYFTIGAILTTLALPPDIPLAMNCGSCTRCFTACPGKALSHERFNPWRCKSYLTQKKEVLNEEEKIFFVRRRLSSDVMSARNAVPLMKMQHTLPFRKRVQTGSPVWKEKHWNRFQTADLQKNMENMLFPGGAGPSYSEIWISSKKINHLLHCIVSQVIYFLLRFIYFRKKTG